MLKFHPMTFVNKETKTGLFALNSMGNPELLNRREDPTTLSGQLFTQVYGLILDSVPTIESIQGRPIQRRRHPHTQIIYDTILPRDPRHAKNREPLKGPEMTLEVDPETKLVIALSAQPLPEVPRSNLEVSATFLYLATESGELDEHTFRLPPHKLMEGTLKTTPIDPFLTETIARYGYTHLKRLLNRGLNTLNEIDSQPTRPFEKPPFYIPGR